MKKDGEGMSSFESKMARVLPACGAILLTAGLSGCGPSFEGSGSKDAASAEQLALRADDPWVFEVESSQAAPVYTGLADGVYTGTGLGMDGLITVQLFIQDDRITCLGVSQEGETQSVGGFEAIRDGTYAAMIDAAQCSDIDTISGATFTTSGVKQAVDDALIQAGAPIEPREMGSGALPDGE